MMPVENVFSITGRGTVATGRVEREIKFRVGDEVEIVGIEEETSRLPLPVLMFRKIVDYAEAGVNVGTLLRGITRDQSNVVSII